MKIYHKNSLYSALAFLGIGLLFALEALQGWRADREFSSYLWGALGQLIFALFQLRNATNKKRAKELLIRDSDEMLLMKSLKSFRAAFYATMYLMLLVCVLSSHLSDSKFGLAMMVCSLLMLGIMLFTLLFASLAYHFQDN